MPIRKTPLVTGETYHIYNRGINKRKIFFTKHDYDYILGVVEYYTYVSSNLSYSKFKKLAKYKRSEYWEESKIINDKLINLIAFCLMPNHFHLVFTQKS